MPFLAVSDTWKATHWLFRLEDGIARRALAGSLLSWLAGNKAISLEIVNAVSAWICVLFAIAFALLIVRHTQSYWHCGADSTRVRWLDSAALIYFATTPGGLRQHLSDLGRFDALGGLIILFSVLLLGNHQLRSVTARAVSTNPVRLPWHFPTGVVLCSVSVLIHEAFVFWVVPVFCLVWWWHSSRSFRTTLAFISGAVALIVVTLLAWTFDYGRLMSLEEAKGVLAARSNFLISDASLMIHFRDLASNVDYTQARAWNTQRLLGLMLAASVLLPQLIILASMLRITRSANNSRELNMPPAAGLFMAASLSPLLLSLLGHDQGRWLAMSSFATSILSLLLWSRLRNLNASIPRWIVILLLLTSVLQIISGPFGITHPMPVHPLRCFLDSYTCMY